MKLYINVITGQKARFSDEVAKRLPTVTHNGKNIQPWKQTPEAVKVESENEIKAILEGPTKVESPKTPEAEAPAPKAKRTRKPRAKKNTTTN